MVGEARDHNYCKPRLWVYKPQRPLALGSDRYDRLNGTPVRARQFKTLRTHARDPHRTISP